MKEWKNEWRNGRFSPELPCQRAEKKFKSKHTHIYTCLKISNNQHYLHRFFLMTKLDVLQDASFLLATKLEESERALWWMVIASMAGKPYLYNNISALFLPGQVILRITPIPTAVLVPPSYLFLSWFNSSDILLTNQQVQELPIY